MDTGLYEIRSVADIRFIFPFLVHRISGMFFAKLVILHPVLTRPPPTIRNRTTLRDVSTTPECA